MSDSSWWVDSSELDQEQLDVIGLPAAGNFLVTGPPGSGKTNLLLLRASYLVDAQLPNIAILVFTRSLREFVAGGSVVYSFPSDKIQTIMRWEQRLIREHADLIEQEGMSFMERRLAHAEQLKSIFDSKPALEHHLDCVLVDEVQDCLPEEIELFFRAAKNVFFVGDHRQQIFKKNGIIDSIAERIEHKKLTKHYRNGELICKVADEIGKNFGEPPLVGACNYDETKAKSSVTFDLCKDGQDLVKKIETKLSQQLKAYPGELIGIACPKNDDVNYMREQLEKSALVSPFLLPEAEFRNAFNPDQRICLCTMHDAKGLEFRAMHLPFCEHLKIMGETQKRLGFTSVTRAKTSLSVYHVETLPGYMEQGREAIAPPRSLPKVSDLFPGRKG